MAVTLHAAADHRTVENVEGGKQRRGAVPRAVVGLGARMPRACVRSRRERSRAWIWIFFVERLHDRMGQRGQAETYNILHLLGEDLIVRALKCVIRCGWSRLACQILCTERSTMPVAWATARLVQ